MRTLTNTQINKIEDVVAKFLTKKIEKKCFENGFDFNNMLMINKEFFDKYIETKIELIDKTQSEFENDSQDKKITIEKIEEVANYIFNNDFDSQELLDLTEEDEDEEEEDENGNIIVIENDDVYDYDYNSIIRDFNDSYFHDKILKVDNLDKKEEENADFLFKGLHLSFDNTCSILTLQTSQNYKEKFIDLRIEEIYNECNDIKSFDIKTEELKEIFFEEFDRRYELDSEDFEEIYEYSLSKICAVLDFLEEEIEERIEERNEKEEEYRQNNLKK